MGYESPNLPLPRYATGNVEKHNKVLESSTIINYCIIIIIIIIISAYYYIVLLTLIIIIMFLIKASSMNTIRKNICK